ncbi:argininosuccinate lyase [Phenylobacterium sp. SCN 70-31]|uniref:argininosuccinate lyase n=1 Tax=Phenylobacterium sp. SCN 70-31 TaxID=1660129 RepID=UPI0008690B2D|nr:argininosuccinate lyase [Phenylobacterium sp. SCN 70-31]ODT86664.1 MAG: hypothetical protein ABS78_15370 [Phenylobacterium sp. SCN 70-31]
MLKRIVALSAPVVLLASPVMAGDQDFQVYNKTGYTISEVYVSASNADDWEEDVMEADVLADGEAVDIEFARGTKGCRFDLKVVYDDGTPAVWNRLDLCSVSKVTLRYDRNADRTWATTD